MGKIPKINSKRVRCWLNDVHQLKIPKHWINNSETLEIVCIQPSVCLCFDCQNIFAIFPFFCLIYLLSTHSHPARVEDEYKRTHFFGRQAYFILVQSFASVCIRLATCLNAVHQLISIHLSRLNWINLMNDFAIFSFHFICLFFLVDASSHGKRFFICKRLFNGVLSQRSWSSGKTVLG